MEINPILQKTYSLSEKGETFQVGPVGFDVPVRQLVEIVINKFKDLLPKNPAAHILLKPNCNNDLHPLLGNATDLRILKAVVDILKQRGYEHIVIADGPNIGTYRKQIDVFQRLGIRSLARHTGVRLIDLNEAPAVMVELSTDRVAIPEIFFNSDFVISLPKFKTHAEAVVSFAMKNLIGCVCGVDKRKVHNNLAANIAALNKAIPVHMIIGDGLIVMEGNGPGDGQPFFAGMLLAGTDAFWLDGVSARLMGFDPHQIPAWQKAASMRRASENKLASLMAIQPVFQLVPAPPRGFWVRLLDHPGLAAIRDKTRSLHSRHRVRSLLYHLKLLQDVYSQADSRIDRLVFHQDRCDACQLCEAVCPLGSPPCSRTHDSSACLTCLSCYWICPQDAIAIEGEMGYILEHRNRFSHRLKRLRDQMVNNHEAAE